MTGLLVVNVGSACQYLCGIRLMHRVRLCMIHHLFPMNLCCLSTQAPMHLPVTRKLNVGNQVGSLVTQMSWIHGRRHHSRPKLLASGKTTTTCSSVCSHLMCARRVTTSFAHGCSPPWFVHTSNMMLPHGRMLPCLVGFLTQTARRCRNQRATL